MQHFIQSRRAECLSWAVIGKADDLLLRPPLGLDRWSTNTATVSKDTAINPQPVKITKFDVKTGAVAGEFTLQTTPPRKTTCQAQIARSSGMMEARGFFLFSTSSLTNAPRLSGRVVLKNDL